MMKIERHAEIMNNGTRPTKYIGFMKSVYGRPEIYTLGGTYEECYAFLEGYFSALAKSSDNFPDVAVWNELRQALSDHTGISDAGAFIAFRNSSIDNKAACNKMVEFIQRLFPEART